ncbi:medium-chain acyl-CoA ligase ACSF2, mitochondrial-like [Amphiura filiformis]|uniref:medium-chain acyl-CoA ligase ACSF2, mitochondrial-like n=1 Tax=Amphiura filiformis TaxID=82378 RepID=UPI003B213A47
MGVMDENGFIRVIGRKSDFLIIEGVNVSPYNLEKVLDEHPSIANVMVVGVPDKRTNEAVCVCIRLKPGMQLSEDEVKKFSENKVLHGVSQYLTPRYVVFMDEFPATPTGKFHRMKIAQMAAEKLCLTSK